MTTPWETERDQLSNRLLVAEAHLRAVLDSPAILYRVRQSAQRAVEQIKVAQQQLAGQEAPL